jgi:hypothetical protein
MREADANRIRDKALKACTDQEAAQDAWRRVRMDGRCHGKTSRAARLAMLEALADGGSVADAETLRNAGGRS